VNGIVKYKPRNDAVLAVCYRCMDEGRKTLVLVSEIQHGKFLEQEIERHYGNNDHHRFMYANASSMTRKRTFDELENGALNMLISTSLTDEGVDLPAIDAVVLAGAGKSRIKSIQRVGRGMRRGGKDLVVYDFMDEHHRKLIKHARKRSRDYQSMGAERVDVVGVGQL
jgi:superfamily II DNA or RNA helicase